MADQLNMNLHETTRVPLNKIKLSRNSRLDLREEELDGLMQSIKQTGLLQPIGLIKRPGGFEIAFGNRRFLACSKLGWTAIPAIIREEKNEFDIDIQNLTENVQRRNITFVEIGRFIDILDKEGLSIRECAVRLGVTNDYVRNALEAYRRVPIEHRDSIEVNVQKKPGDRTEAGKITIRQASAITQQSRKGRLDRKQQDVLYRAAKKHGAKFKPEHIKQYVHNVRQGLDPMASAVQLKELKPTFWMTIEEYERLHKKFVVQGPFKFVTEALRGILRGDIAEKIKIEEPKHSD